MLKHITVPIIIDDHEPEKCMYCRFQVHDTGCILYPGITIRDGKRCKQCLEEATGRRSE